ncbi:hypothetical protein ACWC1C_18585 [Streptomyces sp. NPDC001705]
MREVSHPEPVSYKRKRRSPIVPLSSASGYETVLPVTVSIKDALTGPNRPAGCNLAPAEDSDAWSAGKFPAGIRLRGLPNEAAWERGDLSSVRDADVNIRQRPYKQHSLPPNV